MINVVPQYHTTDSLSKSTRRALCNAFPIHTHTNSLTIQIVDGEWKWYWFDRRHRRCIRWTVLLGNKRVSTHAVLVGYTGSTAQWTAGTSMVKGYSQPSSWGMWYQPTHQSYRRTTSSIELSKSTTNCTPCTEIEKLLRRELAEINSNTVWTTETALNFYSTSGDRVR